MAENNKSGFRVASYIGKHSSACPETEQAQPLLRLFAVLCTSLLCFTRAEQSSLFLHGLDSAGPGNKDKSFEKLRQS